MPLTICPVCDGKGWLVNPDMDTRDPNSPDNIKCENCNGEGYLGSRDEDD